MKFFKTLVFLLCLPGLFLQPTQVFSEEIPTFYNEKGKEIFVPRDRDGLIDPFGYFDPQNIFGTHMHGYINHYLDFIDLICDEEFLETLSEEEFDRVVEFAVWAVRSSVPKSRPDLKEQYERDIEELYQILKDDEEEKEEFYFSSSSSQFLPTKLAVCTKLPKILLCKKKKKKGGFWNQIKRKSKHFGYWCKKHKKPVIISTVVVGTAAVAILTGGVGGSAAAAVGGGLIQSMDDPPPRHINKPGNVHFREDYQNSPPQPPPANHYSSMPDSKPSFPPRKDASTYKHSPPTQPKEKCPELEAIHEEIAYQAEITKEKILEETINEPIEGLDDSFIDKVVSDGKTLVSKLAHEAIDTASEATKTVGAVGGVVGHFIDRNYQDSLQAHYYHSHEAIDDLFETDLTYMYSQQGKEEASYIQDKLGIDLFEDSNPDIALGEAIPPGLPLVAGSKAIVPKGGGAVGAAIVGSAIAGSHLPPVVPESVEQPVTVYRSKNKETGKVDYVGITNNFERRFREHWRQKGIFIEPIEGLENLPPKDARATEQALIEIHGLQKNGGSLTNRINSIAEKNPIKAEAVKRGLEILKEAKYDGLEGIIE